MSAIAQQFIDDDRGLEECCTHLSRCSEFGFDTEFIGENTFHPRLCLVQIATADRLYVVDPFSVSSLAPFWNIVADSSRVAVVHAGREEVRMCQLGCGQPPANLFDLQIAAGVVGLGYPLGHGPLVYQLLGAQISKAETLTDWARRPLTDQQMKYAFDDVRYLLPLWRQLEDQLAQTQRTEWAKEEFAALTRRALLENPAVERWRKLRGLGSLDRKRLAVARELFTWREETAERQNRPARTVLRDDLVIEVARRLPLRERDLAVLRGMPRQEHAGILETVARAVALPPEHWPELPDRNNDPPQVGMVTSFLMAVLGDLCVRSSISQSLAASTNDVKLLVRARYHREQKLPAESVLTHGWRRQAILPKLLGVLDGIERVRIANLRSQTPFEVLTEDNTD